jgi:hypothetical protein
MSQAALRRITEPIAAPSDPCPTHVLAAVYGTCYGPIKNYAEAFSDYIAHNDFTAEPGQAVASIKQAPVLWVQVGEETQALARGPAGAPQTACIPQSETAEAQRDPEWRADLQEPEWGKNRGLGVKRLPFDFWP